MSKFIEVTDWDGNKTIINTGYIIMVDRCEDKPELAYIITKDQVDMSTLETYEEIKAMLMYDPAVADILKERK